MRSRIRFEKMSGVFLAKHREARLGRVDALPTPFPSWNRMCGEEGGRVGLAKGWLIVLGGMDGTGKSTLAINLAAHATLERRVSGGLNLEMSSGQYATRYLSILTGTPKHWLDYGDHFRSGAWDGAAVEAAQCDREGGRFYSNDAAVFTLEDIEDAYEALVGEGCSSIFIDYLQLISVPGSGLVDRTEETSNLIRQLTKEHQVTTIALSQFNRETTKSKTAPPTRDGLYGGGSIQKHANQVVLLNHACRAYSPDRRYEYTELIIDKNRHGPASISVKVRWDWKTGRLEEYIPGTDPWDPWGEEGERVEVVTHEADKGQGGLFDDED